MSSMLYFFIFVLQEKNASYECFQANGDIVTVAVFAPASCHRAGARHVPAACPLRAATPYRPPCTCSLLSLAAFSCCNNSNSRITVLLCSRQHEPHWRGGAAPAQRLPGGPRRGRGGAGGGTRAGPGALLLAWLLASALGLGPGDELVLLVMAQGLRLGLIHGCLAHSHHFPSSPACSPQVLLTAGYTGEIKIYENIGLPQWL